MELPVLLHYNRYASVIIIMHARSTFLFSVLRAFIYSLPILLNMHARSYALTSRTDIVKIYSCLYIHIEVTVVLTRSERRFSCYMFLICLTCTYASDSPRSLMQIDKFLTGRVLDNMQRPIYILFKRYSGVSYMQQFNTNRSYE